MAEKEQSPLYDQLAARGVSRRDFVKFCGSMAALLGLSEMYGPRIATALAQASSGGLTPAIWLNLGACTGCTESLAQVDTPDVATIVLDLLSVNYIETIMAAAGKSAEEAMQMTIDDGSYLLIVEGAVMTGEDGNTLLIGGRTGMDVLADAASKCDAIVCVGSCAVDGGWVLAAPNQAGGTGVSDVASDLGFADKPLINLPTCPVNPEWIVAIVVDWLLFNGKVPTLDDANRPVFIYGQTIHDNCPRRGHFENGEFVQVFGSEEEAKGYCLYEMGCKGPTTQTNCPLVRWNRRVSWCVDSGSPCIGCGGPNWVDNNSPFLNRLADVGGKVDPETVALIAGGLTLAGIAGHAVGQASTGRMGKGGPAEDKKGGR